MRELHAALEGGDPERAVAIYAGPFLDGFFIDSAPEFDRWVEAERSELAAAIGEALEALATRAATVGDRAAAARWWARAMIRDLARIVPPRQFVVRALILQAVAESAAGDTAGARQLASDAKAWVDRADLSAAALARLHERLAILGAWVRDHRLVTAVGEALRRLDAGRGLRSFRIALQAVAGARAALDGRPAEAARHLAASREETFHGRSASTVALFEADVAMLAGDRARAMEQFRIPDPDFETWPVLSALATRRLAALERSSRPASGSREGRGADAPPYHLGAGGSARQGAAGFAGRPATRLPRAAAGPDRPWRHRGDA